MGGRRIRRRVNPNEYLYFTCSMQGTAGLAGKSMAVFSLPVAMAPPAQDTVNLL